MYDINLIGAYSLRIMDREKAALASFSSTDFATSFSGYEDKSNYQQFSLHTVTQFSPSPVISGIENVSQDAHISLIEVGNPEDGHSKSYKEASSSNTLQDVHIVRTFETCISTNCGFLVARLSFND